MKIVCKNDFKRNPSDESFGNSTGYTNSTNYDEATDTFHPASINNHFIDYTQSNVSHDCRLLHEILYYFNFNSFRKENFIVQSLVIGIFENLAEMDSRFGTREYELWDNGISNVFMAAHEFIIIISS